MRGGIQPARSHQIMTRRRWIADEVSGNHAALHGSHAHHLAVVLRARVGQQFDIAAGDKLRSGRITSVSPDRVEFELGDEIAVSGGPQITLLMSILKFDRMEWAIEKCTELGVSRIIPVIARRTESHLAKAAAKRVERWQRIVREASEQSRRASPPAVEQPISVKDAIASGGEVLSPQLSVLSENLLSRTVNRDLRTEPTRILLTETERHCTLKDVLQSHSLNSEVLLALGPEGGWTADEVAAFGGAGWIAASLGNTILRAETAAIAAMAVAAAELS